MTRPLSYSLQAQIVALCNRPAPYKIAAEPMEHGAPESLAELCEQSHALGAWRDPSGALLGARIPVWSGASDRTIWDRPTMNWLFRAWHDSHHILLGAEFDRPGEERVARYACGLIQGKPESAILWAELMGQFEYQARHGVYPDAQRDFVRDCVVYGIAPPVEGGLYHKERT